MIAYFRGRLWLWEFCALAWLLLLPYIMTAHGHLDWSGHALGRDFVNYWTAGQLVREGHIAPIFDRDGFLAAEHRLFDPRLPFHFWSYPPVMLFAVAPLGWLPYIPALIAWSVSGVLALIPAARGFFPNGREAILLLACPATAIDMALGQNGALTAAVLIGGLALWTTRPRSAGALLGLLILKPQLAIMLPVAALAGRRWSTVVAAGAMMAGLMLLSVPVFGLGAWGGFLTHSLAIQQLMLTQGAGPFQWMMPTVLMSGRLFGLPTIIAATLQAVVALAAVCTVWAGWRSSGDMEAKSALLMTATFVASPQAFNYDLIPAACAAIVLWRRDRTTVGQAVALATWGLPIAMISLQAVDVMNLRDFAVRPLTILTPTVLIGAMWRLYRLCLQPSESRAANASTAGELASNT